MSSPPDDTSNTSKLNITSSAEPDNLQLPKLNSDTSIIEQPPSPTMHSDTTSEDGTDYLSDSTYEIVSRSSFQTSDSDDDTTDGTRELIHDVESVAESAISAPSAESEDEESIDFTPLQSEHEESFEEMRLRYQAGQPSASEAGINTPPMPDEVDVNEQLSVPSLENSTIRASNITTLDASKPHEDWIKFKEPMTSVADGLLNVAEERHDDSSSFSISHALADHNLVVTRPSFRILYCGNPDLKNTILHKIAQAISLSPRAKDHAYSGRVLRPISNFIISSPDFMLLPGTGIQLQVHHCSIDDMTKYLLVRKTDDEQTLAVFVHPKGRDQSKAAGYDRGEHSSRQLLGSMHYARRCPFPRLDICEQVEPSSYKALGYRPYEGQAIHLAEQILDQPRVSMPLDLDSFLALDPFRLNRNFASMFDHSTSQSERAILRIKSQHETCKTFAKEAVESGVEASVKFFYVFREYADHFFFDTLPQRLPTRRSVAELVQSDAAERFVRYGTTVTSALLGVVGIALFSLALQSLSFDLLQSWIFGAQRSIAANPATTMATRDNGVSSVTDAAQLDAMVKRGLRTDSVLRTPASAHSALSTIHPEKGLTVISPITRPSSGWLAKASEPKWTLLQTNESGRLLLVNRKPLEELFLVNLSTTSHASRAIIFNPTDDTAYFPQSQVSMQSQISRYNASAVEIRLSPRAHCGSIINIDVRGFAAGQQHNVPDHFSLSRPCEQAQHYRGLQRIVQHLKAQLPLIPTIPKPLIAMKTHTTPKLFSLPELPRMPRMPTLPKLPTRAAGLKILRNDRAHARSQLRAHGRYLRTQCQAAATYLNEAQIDWFREHMFGRELRALNRVRRALRRVRKTRLPAVHVKKARSRALALKDRMGAAAQRLKNSFEQGRQAKREEQRARRRELAAVHEARIRR